MAVYHMLFNLPLPTLSTLDSDDVTKLLEKGEGNTNEVIKHRKKRCTDANADVFDSEVKASSN